MVRSNDSDFTLSDSEMNVSDSSTPISASEESSLSMASDYFEKTREELIEKSE